MPKIALAAAGLLAALSFTTANAQSPSQVEGQQTTPGNSAGAPGAATTAGNLQTTIETTQPGSTVDPTGPSGAAGTSTNQGTVTSNTVTGTPNR